MERSLFRYIWQHTWRDQVLLLIVTAIEPAADLRQPRAAEAHRQRRASAARRAFPVTVLGLDVRAGRRT
ncbi:MAG: hypothetical protein MZW92_32390 [Comamonadaceae bacterium]|nr:hypothetical protein [Comamonadaceae bacterium]